MELLLQITIFGLTLWLGFYLISRNWKDGRLRLAGLGLLFYAVGFAIEALLPYLAGENAVAQWRAGQRPFLLLPAVCWLWLLFSLLRDPEPLRQRLQNYPRPFGLILAATIFFGMGMVALFFPIAWLSRLWVLLGLSLDLILLGVAIAVLDAFNEGEALSAHFSRSFSYAFATALLFGGQIVLVIWLSTGVTLPMLILLLTTITAAIIIQTFSDGLQAFLDRISLASWPQLAATRAEMRASNDAALRLEPAIQWEKIADDEFARLTRRALSHMGNLPRLAANPLTQLPLIERRLHESGRASDTLTRAAELKLLLQESILRLKPREKGEFGTSDEWRHYNALYFPYVVGLRPYSRRAVNNGLESHEEEAMAWFRTYVPERTLYNWQNAAAKLVAQDLWERNMA